MTGNVLGERFKIVSFGESHGKVVGVVIDGCPAGLRLSEEDVQKELDLRKPGSTTISTARRERDEVEILSGVFEGYTTGAPICMLVRNEDVDSEPYREFLRKPRPGHADYVARVKYGGFNDWRGGGRFSGRITAGFVMAGAVAKKLLLETMGVEVIAYTVEVAGVRAEGFTLEDARRFRYENDVRAPTMESAERMMREIIRAREEGDSVGGIVECQALNLPIGLGEPVFSTLEGELSKAIFSIPGVKGVEFGSGFSCSRMRGSENNDQYEVRDGRVTFRSNNSGGIIGGISNGMPILLRVAFKPTSSIPKPQLTVDLESMKEAELRIKGRHDPCIVPRAVPVVEAMVAVVLADHALRAGFIPPVLRR